MADLVLTEKHITALHWMRHVNRKRLGLYGPSLRTSGPEPFCEDLVAAGLAARVDWWAKGKRGYWITKAGLAALDRAERPQGLLAQLTPEQREAALSFEGPLGSGDSTLPAIKRA